MVPTRCIVHNLDKIQYTVPVSMLFVERSALLTDYLLYFTVAGLTGSSLGVINKNDVYMPIPQLGATSRRSMNPQYGKEDGTT